MQILVISDSHGSRDPVRKLLEMHQHKVQTVLHLGDNVKDLMQFQPEYPALTMVAVAGNCDFYSSAPAERVLTLGEVVSRRILLLHGHSLNVKMSLDRLMYYSQEKEVDACLFGHTHIPAVFSHGSVFFMNPGSVCLPRGMSKAGYGLLTIDDKGNITGEVLEI